MNEEIINNDNKAETEDKKEIARNLRKTRTGKVVSNKISF